jgi:hypothetical protein
MVFNINGFRTQGLPQGGARPSLFEVYFPQSPNIVANENVPDAPVRCMAATHPAWRTTSIDVFYFGRSIPVGGERTFQPWTARFYNEIDFGLRDFFEGWNNMINTAVGNQTQTTDYTSATNGGYKVDGIIVRQFSKQLGLIRSYEFFGLYPETVGEIELNWEAANRIETFDVTFRYDYFIPSTSDTEQAFPGTFDVLGTTAGSAAGSIPLNIVGAAAAPVNAVTGTATNPVSSTSASAITPQVTTIT